MSDAALLDQAVDGDAELQTPPPKPPTRRRAPKPRVKVEEPPPVIPAGGFVGLWLSLTGKPNGATAKGDSGLTLAFVVCFVFGTALCLLGAFEIPFARQISFAGPLLATLTYPIWGCVIGAATKPSLRERLADNSYYLGFIFTQVALLVGFLPAAFGSGELSADQIIRFFGVALGASLIGLVARTILIQMSYTVDEAADVISGEVSSLARQVSEQSTKVLDEFDRLVARIATSQSKLTTELQSGMTALSETVAGYNEALKTDAAVLNERMSQAMGAADRTSRDVDRQQSQLADAVGSVALVMERMRASLESQVHASTESIHATAAAVQQSLDSLRAVEGLSDGISLVGTQIGTLGDRLHGLDERVAGVASSIDGSLRTLDAEVGGAAQRGLERAGAVNSEAEEAIASLERTLQSFRGELDRLRG